MTNESAVKTQFTKGPWTQGSDGYSLPVVFVGPETVALIRTGEADAYLITAAPDLYQRLDETARQFHAGHGVTFDSCTWSQCRENRAALAKARGEVQA